MTRLDPVFRGHMDSKRLVVLDDPRAYTIWRCGFRENEEIELILRKKRKNRSKSQNSYLWGCVYPIVSECTGYTTDESHEAMKMLFLRVHRDGLPDTVKSTTDLDTADFSQYVEQIKDWTAQTFGARIPDASEVYL